MISKLQVFSGVAIALSLSALAVAPAKAEPNETLISQLRGYEVFSPIDVYRDDWLQWRFTEDIAVGRVKAKVGDICFVSFISPSDVEINGRTLGRTKISCGWETSAGDDVIGRFQDDRWVLIDEDKLASFYHTAMPRWVTRLDLKEEVEVQRTAIDWGSSREVELPPLRPQAATSAPMPEPEPAPIQGLW